MERILIVDDEEDMRHLIDLYLSNAGYETLEAEDGEVSLQYIKNNNVSLVLLDIMMPNVDGFQTCKKIREISEVPIIFLSAKGDEWDKVKGLKLGGDDYVLKPFSPGELVARIEAVLRRTQKGQPETGRLTKGVFTIDTNSRKVYIDGKLTTLTLKEYELLYLLLSNEGRIFTRDQLLEYVWGIDYSGGTRTVDTHIKTLRMKLGSHASEMVRTVWGLGYTYEGSL
ncbi:response regulator transcription factor [Bacillus sp. 2205SS5-2]|uniref:response regulator transcription factor n=1 Tax=Bacillus sp. 2205SS5-2 TaxID=3109031 RepID=UPI003005360B